MGNKANVKLAYVGLFENPRSKRPTVVLKAVSEPDKAMAIGVSKEAAVSILTASKPAICEGGPVRPTVHDAFTCLSERAGVKLEKAVIDRLDERGVFAGSIFGSLPGGENFGPIYVRASDAVALALRTYAGIEATTEVWRHSEHYEPGKLPFPEIDISDLLPL